MKAPTMAQIHKAFCARRKVKCVTANLAKDLRWQCHEVATVLAEILTKNGMKARAVYGFWYGTCAERPGLLTHRHGWTVVGDEIWDATRWVFEGKKPYLFRAKFKKHEAEYDEGMRRARNAYRPPFPEKAQGKIVHIDWSYPTYMFLSELIHNNGANLANVDVMNLAHGQLMWIANTDYLALGDHITEIYTKLIEKDLSGFIPTDYQQWWKANK